MMDAVCKLGTQCWLLFTAIVLVPARMSRRQQLCDCGICPEPHICAICLQQARSCALIAKPGMRHAVSGAAAQYMARKAAAVMAERRMLRV